MSATVGTKIKMDGERHRYTIVARDGRFVIMKKPFNARKTYLYTIADLDQKMRGPCDLIFGLPKCLEEDKGSELSLQYLQEGIMGVSSRRGIPLTQNELLQLE
ncbi:MAG: hypothetical protein RIA09_15985 [Hoeflea sp.]|jgi:hypothetical protein|uniref:hypothetical protein n=1 Tax=Hoeflea sp. TaxID=1940281 RepID=UPI0032EAC9FF